MWRIIKILEDSRGIRKLTVSSDNFSMKLCKNMSELVAHGGVGWQLEVNFEILKKCAKQRCFPSRPRKTFVENPRRKQAKKTLLSGYNSRVKFALLQISLHELAAGFEIEGSAIFAVLSSSESEPALARFFLQSVTWLARLFNLGSLGSLSIVMSLPLTVRSTVRTLQDSLIQFKFKILTDELKLTQSNDGI